MGLYCDRASLGALREIIRDELPREWTGDALKQRHFGPNSDAVAKIRAAANSEGVEAASARILLDRIGAGMELCGFFEPPSTDFSAMSVPRRVFHALQALEQFATEGPSGAELIASALDHPDEAIRLGAAELLGEMGNAALAIMPKLNQALVDAQRRDEQAFAVILSASIQKITLAA